VSQPSLEENVVTTLRRIIRSVDLHSRLLLQNCGLTAPQLATLQEVARLQPVQAGVLAKAVCLSQPTMTGILDRLELRGFAERQRNGEDRRSVVVRLTAEGERILQSAPSLLQDHFRAELAKLTEWERTMILATLQRVAAMMDAEQMDAAPVLTTGSVSATADQVSSYLAQPVSTEVLDSQKPKHD
jgi:DNA-binding MarR family transcriptional regulator